ncbi:MAG: carboxy-S-adenosyl-L-methionine synthase CmoA [Pseudomonadota bacterium]
MQDDKLFEARDGRDPFRFDENVARVFPDMLKRSIPGYAASIEAIGSLAARFVKPGTRCYDLGCSLGAATLAMRQGARTDDIDIFAIDTAEAMVSRCRDATAEDPRIRVVQDDIRQVDMHNASMVVLNYTLQFLPPEDRDAMVRRIADGLNPKGLLVLSEKVVDEDPDMETLLFDLHHEHKRRNDYSELEISRKRTALENVLIPETVSDHRRRLTAAGFRHIAVWLRYFNFVSIIAIKGET